MSQKFYTIYKTTCLINNKTYIGQHTTNDLNDGYLGSGQLIVAAIKKYGKENFKKEILHIFENEDEMDAKERELVTTEYCLREDTYNICEGGFGGGFRYINRAGLNEHTKEEYRQYNTIRSQAGIKKLQERLQNPVFKQRWVENISASLTGRTGSFVGRKHSPETIAKMKESHARRKAKSAL